MERRITTSEETKQDVFDAVLDRLAGYQIYFNGWPRESLGDYKRRYATARPDDLPTIPKCVSKEIIGRYGKNSLLDELSWATQDALPSTEVSEWIDNNEGIFAEAWSRGLWIVEETGKVTGYDER
ncbi:hypothetical protein [Lacticaseibacillus mingshuiensis]|uniref:hypothetical protein n=1 Tax=Lacticaseibacillus mingshuiensis TaxID=2799574 RepID=UPI001CEC4696|nr:hypothetical protein [Lacticaseibacillus mingshuiensis]